MERPQNKLRRAQLLYIVGCEGKNQETLYFDRIQELINSDEKRTFNILFDYAEPYGGNPRCVVERTVLKSIGKTNKLSVFDYDGKKKQYKEAIDMAYDNKIELGNTNYCFDLWLILHKSDYFGSVIHQDDYAEYLRTVYGLGKNKDIKKRENVESIMAQITIEDIKNAIRRAEIIDENNKKRTPHSTPKNHILYYDNPDTQIHKAIKNILHKTGVLI